MPDLIKFIPEYNPKYVVSMLSQVEDWGSRFTNIAKYRDITQSRGENVKIVILDSGVDTDHPDLTANIKGMADFTGENDPEDKKGHGTHVCGIVGAADNGMGVIGIAPACELYSGRVLDAEGLCPGDFSWIIAGLEWAIEIGADIVNMSLGAAFPPPPQLHQVVKKATDKGMILIAASGNGACQVIDYPGKFDEVISVAAMDKDGNLTKYSNVGQELDFVAPGDEVYSTYLDGQYATVSGTSMAAPFVTGVTALLIAYHRNGNEHDTPINDYIDLQDHLKKFEKGRLIDLGNNVGIGVLDFAVENQVAARSFEYKVAQAMPTMSNLAQFSCK